MKIPYTKFDLQLALLGLDKKIEDHEEELRAHITDLETKLVGAAPADLNRKIAEHNGISVLDFINSPNMELIRQNYIDYALQSLSNLLKSNYNFSDKEAWAFILASLGNLDE
jgi:hypothetical protein